MELKQFITETLVQISEGVEETDVGHTVTGGLRRPVEFVEFDVAILANEGTETKAGIGITDIPPPSSSTSI